MSRENNAFADFKGMMQRLRYCVIKRIMQDFCWLIAKTLRFSDM